MTVSLMFDALVAILLVATIVFAAVLNRRLAGLRAAKEEMAALARSFTEATAKAESGLGQMRTLAQSDGALLQERIEQARLLKDDLEFLTERANRVAERLQGASAPNRAAPPSRSTSGVTSGAATQSAAPTSAAPDRDADAALAALSPERRALFEALQGMR